MDVGLLREMNLALRDGVWSGRVPVPTGYAVRLPRVAGRPSAETLAAALPRVQDEPQRASASGGSVSRHRVKRGETLSLVARRYGLSTAALAKANGLRTTSKLKIGQTLKIPGGTSTAVAPKKTQPPAKAQTAAKQAPSKATVRSHTVRKGETLSAIARKSGVSVKQLAAANGISPATRVRIGQRLKIPQ